MENWRQKLVEVLRDLKGEAHLNEIYEKIEPSIEQKDSSWKAVVRGNLERNSSDSNAWYGNHDIFELKEKGSGIWRLRTNCFREEILNLQTKFYFLTTGKKEHRDINYEKYTWNIHNNNKLKKGDLFIYRVSQKSSFNKQFYFFGAGIINTIEVADKLNNPDFKEGDVFGNIIKPLEFNNSIFQSDLKPSDLDHKGPTWERCFDNYGIDDISLDKFLFILNKATDKKLDLDNEENKVQIQARKQIFSHNFKVSNTIAKSIQTRGHYQNFFRKIVLKNYNYECAITGIKTKSCLTAAHILRWADYEDHRLDPQNGICLSKLVDACFENNLIFIDDNYKVNLRDEIKKDKKLYEELKKYEGIKINLPEFKECRPNKKFLQIHREKIKIKPLV